MFIKLFRKLDNKGNTLGIVLIGIFILSILGTLILGVTATNYNMKLNDKKSKMTFYNAEKAMDELYTSMGADVMNAVTDSYSYALESYKKNKAANPSATEDMADKAFKETLRNKLVNLYEDGIVYTLAGATDTPQERLLARLTSYLPTAVNYEFFVDAPSGDIEVKYLKADGTSSTNIASVDIIKISNVRVECRSEKTGYVSKIVSDFEISVPEIALDFTDSPMSDGVNDLAKYALLAQGFQLHPNVNPSSALSSNRSTSAITIDDSAKVIIKGNVYADGSVYNATPVTGVVSGVTYYKNAGASAESAISRNPSLTVGKNAVLDINSKVFYCMNDFILSDKSEAYLGNNSSTARDATDSLESLQFYADNIKTDDTSVDAKLYFLGGNCIIRDDLEINGTNSSVYIGGNYFGYGFRDRNHDGIEDDTLGADYVARNGSDVTSSIENEHKDSSAIIVNGKGTYVNMACTTNSVGGILTPDGTVANIVDLRKLVLLGRAYIDLDPKGTNYTYMTGESVSFKGNQQVYLSSLLRDSELKGSKITSNPMLESEIKTLAGKSTLSAISMSTDLNLNPDNVITKAIRNSIIAPTGSVFFYNKVLSPEQQTKDFQNIFAATNTDLIDAEKKAAVIEQLGASNLDVRGFIIPNSVKLYSVGTVMNVNRSGASVSITRPVYGAAGLGMSVFGQNTPEGRASIKNFVNVINNRINNLETSLKDLSEDAVLLADADLSNISSISEESATPSTIPSPYEYYIDRKEMLNSVKNGKIVVQLSLPLSPTELDTFTDNADIYDCSDAQAIELNKELVEILIDAGLLTSSYSNANTLKVGVVLSNDVSGGVQEAIDLDAGIVVSEKTSYLAHNFTGLVMDHDSVVLHGNINVTANEDLVEFLFSNIKALRDVLSSNVRVTPPPTSGYVVGDGNEIKLSYTDLVKKSNWRKDNN